MSSLGNASCKAFAKCATSVTLTCSTFIGHAENVDSLYVWIAISTEKIKSLEDGEQKVEALQQVIMSQHILKQVIVLYKLFHSILDQFISR